MATPVKTVQFRDIDPLIRRFEKLGYPCCAIFHNDRLQIPIMCEDMETAKQELYETLQDYKSSSGIYSLHIYSAEPKSNLDGRTPVFACLNFQLYDYRQSGPAAGPDGNTWLQGRQFQEGHQSIIQEIRELKTEVKTLRDELDEIYEEEEKAGDVAGPVLVGNSWQDKLVEQLSPVIPKIADRLADALFEPKGQTHAISGIYTGMDQDQKAIEAVKRLKPVISNIGDVLLRLAELGEKNPARLKMYVSMMD